MIDDDNIVTLQTANFYFDMKKGYWKHRQYSLMVSPEQVEFMMPEAFRKYIEKLVNIKFV